MHQVLRVPKIMSKRGEGTGRDRQWMRGATATYLSGCDEGSSVGHRAAFCPSTFSGMRRTLKVRFWTQIRPNTRRLQLSPGIYGSKRPCTGSQHRWTSALWERKTFNRGKCTYKIFLIFSYFFLAEPTKSNTYFVGRRALHCSFTAHPSTDDATLPITSQFCTCPLSRAADAILYIKSCV